MKRVLIVDDSLSVREQLNQYVKEENRFQTDLAENGLEAFRKQKRKPYDIIITDLVMPEMEGIELIMKIKKEFPETRIVAMSGANPLYRKMALKVGADLELEKPISQKTINKAIHILSEYQTSKTTDKYDLE